MLPVPLATSRPSIVVGCVAAVLSSACQSVGLILQRKSYLNSDDSLTRSSYNRSLWHLGLFLFLFANVFGSTIQISSLPLIVLSPLQSIGLVFNTIFHTLLLNEPFTNLSLYGTILVSTGAFCTAYCAGNLTEPEYTLAQFLKFCSNVNFKKWVTLNIVFISISLLYITLINRADLDKIRHYNQITGKIFPGDPLNKYKCLGLLYGIVSGILSAFSLLLAKSSIEILISTLFSKDWASLTTRATSLILFIFISLGLSQLFLLNKGLQYISTSVLYPLVFLVYNMTSIANSLIFFQQWSQLTYFTLTILITGASQVMAGVFALSLQGSTDLDDECHLHHQNHLPGEIKLTGQQVQQLPYTSSAAPSPSITLTPPSTSTDDDELSDAEQRVNTSSNSEIVTPILQRTRDNFNNATRKVSNFLNSHNHHHQQNDLARETSPLNTDLHQYISFESLRDVVPNRKSRPSSIIPGTQEYESITQNMTDADTSIENQEVYNEGDSTISNYQPQPSSGMGLGILQPIIGKLKKQASNHDVGDLSNLDTLHPPSATSNLVSSSFKSALSLPFSSLKNLSSQTALSSIDHQHDGGNGGDFSTFDKGRLLRHKKSSTLRVKLDEVEDYNPNNTFNYSANNTLEEIQAQMDVYEAPIQKKLNPYPHAQHLNTYNSNKSSSQPTSPIGDQTPLDVRKLFVTKQRGNTDSMKYKDLHRLTVTGGEGQATEGQQSPSPLLPQWQSQMYSPTQLHSPTQFSRSYRRGRAFSKVKHARVLSFEQTELLNTLKKKEEHQPQHENGIEPPSA